MNVNGSIFKAYDIRGVVGTTLDEALAEHLGRAFGTEALRLGEKANSPFIRNYSKKPFREYFSCAACAQRSPPGGLGGSSPKSSVRRGLGTTDHCSATACSACC